MEYVGKPGMRQYLQDLISTYKQQLETPFMGANLLFIEEELFKCTYKLRKIKEADMEAMIKTSAYHLGITN